MVTLAAPGVQDPFLPYALDLVGDWLGHELRRVEGEPVDILYGDAAAAPARLRIPRVARYTVDDVPRPDPPGDDTPARRAGESFPFDLFAALRFWLADEAHQHETDSSCFDDRGRLLARHSAQARTGTLERPVVNACLLLFRHFFEHGLGVRARRLLPAGTRCVVALTHDVDRPIDPRDPREELRLAARAVRRGVRVREAVDNAARRTARGAIALARREGRHWVFDEVVAEEAKRGFTSAYFFAATHRYDAAGHTNDVGYDLRAPRMRRLLRSLRERDVEVGLHIGYLAGDGAAISRERQIAEQASGGPIAGSRHHYFMPHPFWGSLQAHADAGLRYDTSVGFNEAPGYRLGIALPFRPWNPQTGRAVDCVQVPTFAMDAALFADPGTDEVAAAAHVERLLAGLKAAEGVAALDWHDYSSYPGSRSHAAWGRAYLRVLDLLAADPEVEVRRPSDIAGLAVGGGYSANSSARSLSEPSVEKGSGPNVLST